MKLLPLIPVPALVLAVACGPGGGHEVVDLPPPTSVTAFLVEAGGPIDQTDLRALTDAVCDELVVLGAAVRVWLIDGPNAVTFAPVTVGGLTSDGQLETAAVNGPARQLAAEPVCAALTDTLTAVLSTAPSLDDGRDIEGALEAAARAGADSVTVLFSSGGVHRTELEDWLADPISIDVTMPTTMDIRLLGVGNVPTIDGGPPPIELTTRLMDAWTTWCEGFQSCEVTS